MPKISILIENKYCADTLLSLSTCPRVQVFVGDHVPPPPWSLAPLLDKFVSWLNSRPALALHPVRLAALAHYKLVHIHPW